MTVAPSAVNGTDVTVVYGEPIVVTVASENATAVIYNITNAAGVVVADTQMAANGTITDLDLAVGEYTVNYVTVVDANHTVATNTSKITVTVAPSAVNGTDVTVVYGEPIVVTVASENATGVTYVITGEGVELSGTVQDGVITIDEDLLAGEYTVTLTTKVDANHTVATNTSKITVNRLSIIITIGNYTTTPGTTVPVDITVVDERGDNVTITLTVVVTGPNATDSLPQHEGKLVFAFTTDLGADGEQVEITDGKGTYYYQVPDSAKDGESFIVTASSEQTGKYEAAEGTGYIDVIQYETTTTISDASGKPGETVTLDVEVTTEDGTPFNGDVVITCPDGKKVTVTVKDGKGQFDWTIPEDAKAGDEYQFTATFEGNSTYLASSGNGTVTVEEPEPKPEPPVPVPEPEPEEPVVTPAKMLNTGNPLVALLAAFVLIGLGLKRREEE